MSELYLDEKHNILYQQNKSGYYEPIAINYNIETNECELISNIPYLFNLVRYVNFVRREKNPKDGSYRVLPLFVYQWSSIIDHIIRTLNPKSERILNTWSRQAKQNWSV